LHNEKVFELKNVGLVVRPVLSFSPAKRLIAGRRIFASFCDKKYYPRFFAFR
jgi:hypothetical protein